MGEGLAQALLQKPCIATDSLLRDQFGNRRNVMAITRLL
jgi:hypothetical protein